MIKYKIDDKKKGFLESLDSGGHHRATNLWITQTAQLFFVKFFLDISVAYRYKNIPTFVVTD